MLRLSSASCMLRLGLRLSVGSCILSLRLGPGSTAKEAAASLSMHEPMLSLSLSIHEPMLSLSMLVLNPNHPD